MTPADSPKTVTLSASATVGIAAQATSIAVTAVAVYICSELTLWLLLTVQEVPEPAVM